MGSYGRTGPSPHPHSLRVGGRAGVQAWLFQALQAPEAREFKAWGPAPHSSRARAGPLQQALHPECAGAHTRERWTGSGAERVLAQEQTAWALCRFSTDSVCDASLCVASPLSPKAVLGAVCVLATTLKGNTGIKTGKQLTTMARALPAKTP